MSNKILPFLAIPAIALGMLAVTADESEARRGGFRMGMGFHKPFAAHRSMFHRPILRHRVVVVPRRRVYRHPIIVHRAPVVIEKRVYTAPRRVITKPAFVAPARVVETAPTRRSVAAPIGKPTDGEGRIYDRAGKAWFDGEGRCYKGTLPWSFKQGEWHYGSALWQEGGEGWVARNARQPQSVDCARVPAFAGKVSEPAPVADVTEEPSRSVATPLVSPATPRGAGRQIPTSAEIDAPVTKAKAPATVAAPASTSAPVAKVVSGKGASGKMCERYLPAIGAMIQAPCGE